VAKRQRTDASGALVPAAGTAAAGGTLVAGPQRTSDLLAPILLLAGHGAAVHTVKFSPGGELLLSGSHDKTLLLWETFGECKNVLTLKGHANAVVEVHWLGAENAVSASADKLVALWDVKTGGRIRMYKGHTSFVNSCCPAADAPLIVSGGDDSVARVWDTRVRTCQSVLDHPLPVTAVSTSADGKEVYTGCVDGCVRVYDLRKSDGEPKLKLRGHDDIVTGIALSPDGQRLLSNAMDNTLRCWDVRPFCEGGRCEKLFLGAQHNYEKGLLKCAWSADGARVACGSADHFVYVWDAATKRIKYKLPGHTGSINEVAFHPTQPILASCANDKHVYLGEIRP